MIKNKYRSEYQATARLTPGGKIVQDYYYTGDYYCLPLDEAGKKKTRIMNFLFGLGMLTLVLAAGLINADSSRTIWIVIPYIFLFLPCAYMLIGAGAYWGTPLRMEHAAYNNSIIRMQRSCWGVIVLSIINAILDIVFIVLNHKTIDMGREVLYCVILVVLMAVGIAFGKYFDKVYVPVTMERNQ